jgi:two-component system, NarL family, response regulator LiaR
MLHETVTLILVDDHAIVRQGLRAYLGLHKDLEIVGEAESGEQGVELVREKLPSVVLMDLLMPGGIDGVEATRQIRAASPSTHVIVLTSYADDERVFPAIKAGALSYLLKDTGPEELLRAVRGAARGEAVLHPSVAARLVREITSEEGRSPIDELTEREREVLICIANGMSNNEIADHLVIGERTVKTHVSNILGKLHLADRTQAAIYALRQKLVPLDQ